MVYPVSYAPIESLTAQSTSHGKTTGKKISLDQNSETTVQKKGSRNKHENRKQSDLGLPQPTSIEGSDVQNQLFSLLFVFLLYKLQM